MKESSAHVPFNPDAGSGWQELEQKRRNEQYGYGLTLYGWDGDTLAWESSAHGGARTTHYVYEPGSFVPLVQATHTGPVKLHPQPVYGAHYDINEDPLWVQAQEPSAFTTVAYYQCDHLGTPQELTDAQGGIAWSAQYRAWGEAKQVISEAARKAGIHNPIRFQGQYADHETGLHYNRHRYYDPQTGRFISKDPIGLQGGLNPHLYAPDPISWIDPLGLKGVYLFETTQGKAYIGKGKYGRYSKSVKERANGPAGVDRGAHIDVNSPCNNINDDDYAFMVESVVMGLYPFVPKAKPVLNAIDSPGTKKLSEKTNVTNLVKCPGLRKAVGNDAAKLIAKMTIKPSGSGM
jgi:RHS repeat-associated protein